MDDETETPYDDDAAPAANPEAPLPPRVRRPPGRPRTTIADTTKAADALIKQAAALKSGERRCVGRVKLRPDMTRVAAPDNPYFRNDDGSIQTRPCQRYAVLGGRVCPKHGGKAPQVKRKAERRLLALVEPSLIRLGALVDQTEHLPTALGAIRTVLERAGGTGIGVLRAGDAGEARPAIQINIMPGGVNLPTPAVTVDAVAVDARVLPAGTDADPV